MDDDADHQRKQRKRERNARAYLESKASRDHAVLRLDKGGLARLDAASAAAGLSRAAFARLFLSPLVDALGPRLAAIDKARSERRQSVAQFLGLALDAALAEARVADGAPPPAAIEFDALFGPSDGGGA